MKLWQRIIKYLALLLAGLIVASAVYGAVSLVTLLTGAIFPKSAPAAVSRDFEAQTVISSLDVDVAGGLTVKVDGAATKVRVSTLDPQLTFAEQNGVLTVKRVMSFPNLREIGKTVIYLPSGSVDALKINAGAGELSLDGLTARELSLDLGAGSAKLTSVNVTEKTVIDGGAGKLELTGVELANATIDLGVGKCTFFGVLSGENVIDCGVGSVDIRLAGKAGDYDVESEDGLFGAELTPLKGGPNKIRIEGGVGRVSVKMADEAENG